MAHGSQCLGKTRRSVWLSCCSQQIVITACRQRSRFIECVYIPQYLRMQLSRTRWTRHTLILRTVRPLTQHSSSPASAHSTAQRRSCFILFFLSTLPSSGLSIVYQLENKKPFTMHGRHQSILPNANSSWCSIALCCTRAARVEKREKREKTNGSFGSVSWG